MEQEASYRNQNWRLQASCRNADPSLFFPDGYGKKYDADIDAAKAFCGSCAVRAYCLETALQTREEHGIWGGTTPDERKAILRQRRATN